MQSRGCSLQAQIQGALRREVRSGRDAGIPRRQSRPTMPTGIYPRPPIVADRLRWLGVPVDGFKT